MKLGIIGCGYWGPNLIRNFNSIDGIEMACCADLDEKRLAHIKGLYPKIESTRDYRKILENKEIEAVVIATPVETHHRLVKESLLAGKHVLVEKPITNNSKDASELIKIAEKNKKILMVDHTFEYSSPVRKIKELLKNNELGNIMTIDMVRVNLGLFQEKVNVIWDLAPHDISMLLYYLEEMPLAARAIGQSYIRDGIEDDAHVTLEFSNKVMANMHLSWLDPVKIRKTTIVGNKKMLLFDDTLENGKVKLFDKGVTIQKNNIPRQPYYDTYKEWTLTYRSGETQEVEIENKEPLNVMANHFIDCIKKNKKPLTNGHSGLNVVKVIEAAQESLKKGGIKIKIK